MSPKTRTPASKKAQVLRWRDGRWSKAPDALSVEEPLEIRLRGRNVAVTMRTPGHDEELAAGFLLTEGIIHQRADVVEIAHCQRGTAHAGNTLNVFLSADVAVDFDRLTRHVFATSSCGLCGKASIDAVRQHFPKLRGRARVSIPILQGLPDLLRAAQPAFSQTGGLHAAAVFDTKGQMVVAREDVGRHNAVDKVIGHGYLQSLLPFDRHILLVSGRASFEILQKALGAGFPIVAAVSAPSSLAVSFAEESGQTLIGFLRGNTLNAYANAQRIRP